MADSKADNLAPLRRHSERDVGKGFRTFYGVTSSRVSVRKLIPFDGFDNWQRFEIGDLEKGQVFQPKTGRLAMSVTKVKGVNLLVPFAPKGGQHSNRVF